MPFSHWDGSLVLNHAIIDDDHKNLSESIAVVIAAFESDSEDAAAWLVRVTAALEVLRETSAAHFRSEEWIMQMGGYTGIDAHRHQHRILLDELNNFIARGLTPGEASNQAAVGFFQEWFEFHIRVWDSALVRWLNGRAGKNKVSEDDSGA